ncbi:X-linked retinitis pigmentosa GTPase regulator [Hippoglossus hippoglossus]|uniref:X-linked retinitis pigmentosa GTPase regulator n=1 Tax=Hippoglossus hippoglossus TaxID=8267 RepID=UPI00148D3BEA|nr:X-linked retinitis pigmentosa GTPase regulator [Hippoglossus hippoglossus]
MTGQTDADIPETGAIFTFGKSSFADNVPSKFWLKNDHPVHISCGGAHTSVITDNGRILMFGANTCGQLGLGFKRAASKPASVKALKSETVKLVACGRDHTIVCTWQGCVYGAGSNQEGQLGLGHCSNTTSFALLPPFFDHAPVRMLSAGCNTSAALTEDGRLFMWGDNSVGQLGLGDEGSAAEPREVDVGEAVMWVSCGYHHSAFVTVDGGLYTFGESANGRLGLQTEQLANHTVPQRVQGILGRVIQVSCGGEHTAALTEENVYTFGRGQYGQLGHGTFLFEVDLPKPLEHFSNSSNRHVSCGENHTAVITENGLLYTFGDSRHGKLGSGEENFTNQFSPTLCRRFLKYNVQLVSCGCNHMLVLAAPKPPESHEVVPEKDVTINESLLRLEMLLLDTLTDPTPLVPKSALAARARHREKESSVDLFGEMFQNLPRLNSDFLNASWQTSRNVLSRTTRSKDVTTPSSPPKPLSDAPPSPPLSPAPLSESVSSKPSSLHSQSSLQSKFHRASSSTSDPKDFPSSMPSPKSVTKRNPNVLFPKRIGKNRVQHTSGAKKALNGRMSSHTTGLREREGLASSQTEGENVQRQVISEDLQNRRAVDSDILPDTEKKKGRALRRTTKDGAAFAEQLQSGGKIEKTSHGAFPAELLKGCSSLKKGASATKKNNHKATSKGKENITKQPNKIQNQDEKKAQKELYHVKSTKHSRNKPSELNEKAPQSIHLTKAGQRATALKESGRKSTDLQAVHINQEDVIELIRTANQEESNLSALDKTSPVIKVTEGNETNSMSVQRGSSTFKGNAAEEDVKRAPIQIKRTDVKLAPTRDVPKVKSAAGKGQSKKLSSVKKGNTPVTTPEKALSVTSTPVKVKGKQQKLKSTPVKNNAVQSRSEGHGADKSVNSTDQRMKGKPADEQKLPGDKKAQEKPVWEKGEEIMDKGEADTKDNKGAKLRSNKTVSPQQDTPTPVVGNTPSSQTPQRTEEISVSGAKFLQAFEPADRDLLVSQRENKEAEDKPRWAQILSDAVAVLPAAGMAGAAVEVLADAVTSVQADISDTAVSTPSKASSRGKQFTKQSAIRQASFASTLSSAELSNQEEENAKKHAQVSVPLESRNRVQEDDCDDRDQSEHEAVKSDTTKQTGVEDCSQTEVHTLKTSQQDHEEEEDEDQKTSKVSREDVGEEDESKKGEYRETEDEEEEGESVSNVDDEEEEEEEDRGKSSCDKKDQAESVSGEGEQEGDDESEEEEGEEETNSSSEEEDKGTEKNNSTEIEEEEEGEEEESSEAMGEGGSESEAVEEEEEGSEQSNEEEEDESEVSEDEEDESGEESGSTIGSKSEEEEEKEEKKGSDTAESAGSDEEEDEEEEVEEEGETEEQKDDQDSTESEDEEKDSEDEESDESKGEKKDDENQGEVSVDIEEEEEEDNESDEEEEEQDEFSEKEDEACEEDELSDEGENGGRGGGRG